MCILHFLIFFLAISSQICVADYSATKDRLFEASSTSIRSGSIINVSPDTPGGINAAVRSARSGDTIRLSNGLYSGVTHCDNVVAGVANVLIIESASTASFTDMAVSPERSPVIDCRGRNRFLSIVAGKVILSRVVVMNGVAPLLLGIRNVTNIPPPRAAADPKWTRGGVGGCILVDDKGELTASAVTMLNCRAMFGGAIGALAGSVVTITGDVVDEDGVAVSLRRNDRLTVGASRGPSEQKLQKASGSQFTEDFEKVNTEQKRGEKRNRLRTLESKKYEESNVDRVVNSKYHDELNKHPRNLLQSNSHQIDTHHHSNYLHGDPLRNNPHHKSTSSTSSRLKSPRISSTSSWFQNCSAQCGGAIFCGGGGCSIAVSSAVIDSCGLVRYIPYTLMPTGSEESLVGAGIGAITTGVVQVEDCVFRFLWINAVGRGGTGAVPLTFSNRGGAIGLAGNPHLGRLVVKRIDVLHTFAVAASDISFMYGSCGISAIQDTSRVELPSGAPSVFIEDVQIRNCSIFGSDIDGGSISIFLRASDTRFSPTVVLRNLEISQVRSRSSLRGLCGGVRLYLASSSLRTGPLIADISISGVTVRDVETIATGEVAGLVAGAALHVFFQFTDAAGTSSVRFRMSNVSIENATLLSGRRTAQGAGVYLYSAMKTLRNLTVSFDLGDIFIRNVTTTSVGQFAQGGAVYLLWSKDGSLEGPSSTVLNLRNVLVVDSFTLNKETSTEASIGGCMYIYILGALREQDVSIVDIRNITLQKCAIVAEGSSGAVAGGALGIFFRPEVRRHRLIIDSMQLVNSSAISSGEARGGALYLAGDGLASISNAAIENNGAIEGGGALVANSVTAELFNCSIRYNIGGGIMILSSSGSLQESIIEGNSALVVGGGVYITSSSVFVLDNVLFRDNTAPLGSAIATSDQRASVTVRNSIIEGVGDDLVGAIFGNSSQENTVWTCREPHTGASLESLAGVKFFFECTKCPTGTYSVVTASSEKLVQCQGCPIAGVCLDGALFSTPAYWGLENPQTHLVSFLPLPEGYGCSVVDSVANCAYDYCAGGREGLLCSKCKAGTGLVFFAAGCKREDECRDSIWGGAIVAGCGLVVALGLIVTTTNALLALPLHSRHELGWNSGRGSSSSALFGLHRNKHRGAQEKRRVEDQFEADDEHLHCQGREKIDPDHQERGKRGDEDSERQGRECRGDEVPEFSGYDSRQNYHRESVEPIHSECRFDAYQRREYSFEAIHGEVGTGFRYEKAEEKHPLDQQTHQHIRTGEGMGFVHSASTRWIDKLKFSIGSLPSTWISLGDLLPILVSFYQISSLIKNTSWRFIAPTIVGGIQAIFSLAPPEANAEEESQSRSLQVVNRGLCLLRGMTATQKIASRLLVPAVTVCWICVLLVAIKFMQRRSITGSIRVTKRNATSCSKDEERSKSDLIGERANPSPPPVKRPHQLSLLSPSDSLHLVFISSVGRLVIIAYTIISLVVLQLSQCIDIEQFGASEEEVEFVSVLWWDAQVECFQVWQVGVIAVLCIVGLLPALLCILMVIATRSKSNIIDSAESKSVLPALKRLKSRLRLLEPAAAAIAELLTQNYHPRRRWYLGITLYERFFIAVVYSTAADRNWRAFLMIFISSLSLTLHLYFQPYRHKIVNTIGFVCQILLCFLCVSTIPAQARYQSGSDVEPDGHGIGKIEWLQSAIFALPLLIAITVLIVSFATRIVRGRRKNRGWELGEIPEVSPQYGGKMAEAVVEMEMVCMSQHHEETQGRPSPNPGAPFLPSEASDNLSDHNHELKSRSTSCDENSCDDFLVKDRERLPKENSNAVVAAPSPSSLSSLSSSDAKSSPIEGLKGEESMSTNYENVFVLDEQLWEPMIGEGQDGLYYAGVC